MDIGVALGLLAGFGVLLAGISLTGDGSALRFFDPASVLITLGGAACAVLVRFPLRDVLAAPRAVVQALRRRPFAPRAVIGAFRGYAETARRNGLLALEAEAAGVRDPFLRRGLQLAVDGTEPATVEDLMRTDLEGMVGRHERGIEVLKALAAYLPAFGMIGTLIGLVILLEGLRNPDSIGPAMSVAIITTFYGAVASYLVVGPLAEKLALYSREEQTAREMIIRGVRALQAGDNPMVVEQKLAVFLPPPGGRVP